MNSYDLIIREGQVAQEDGTTMEVEIACHNGRIVKIDSAITQTATEEIHAAGHLVLPGIIDAQVHFRDPGLTHKEDLCSGSRAAVRGGVTSFLEMPNTSPPTISQLALNRKLERAASCSVANYGFFIGATPRNLSVLNSAAPACGIKIFMGSSTGNLLIDQEHDLRKIFQTGSRLIAVHAEDEDRMRSRSAQFLTQKHQITDLRVHSKIRDDRCALLATRRATELSHEFSRRLHILHLTSAVEVDYLSANKTEHITVECTPNHLFLTMDDYDRLGSLMQMNPPIRTQNDQDALWRGLHSGIIDFIATDHAPHTLEEKQQPYPNSPSGMPGVETSLPLMATAWKSGKCDLKQLLKWMCWGPADAYKITGKGRIAEGMDADLTIIDVDNYREVRNRDMFTKVKWSPYQGMELTGWPLWTVVSGQIAFSNEKIQENVLGSPIAFAPSSEGD